MLTDAQKATLAADIIAVNTATPGTIASGDTVGAAIYYNTVVSPAYVVWNPSTATKDIMDAVTWANLTPTDAPDGTAAWTNRALACQGKQFNVQTMLVGRDFVDGTKSNLRSGLQDALTNVPSGTNGATVSGGWANVKIALTRSATRIEQLFATGNGTAASPSVMAYVGKIQPTDFNSIV